jgi:hypothetical protein
MGPPGPAGTNAALPNGERVNVERPAQAAPGPSRLEIETE